MDSVLVFTMSLISVAIVDSKTIAGPSRPPRWDGAPVAVLHFSRLPARLTYFPCGAGGILGFPGAFAPARAIWRLVKRCGAAGRVIQ